MISIIAAVGKNLELGKNNDLIWHLKADMQNFKKLTMDKKIVMGTKTYESLPKKLEGRSYIVLSHSLKDIDDVQIFSDFFLLLNYLNTLEEEIMIIGGASIYKLFLPYADNLYLTEINETKESDVYFPEFDEACYNKQILAENEEDNVEFKLVLYRRKGSIK